MMRPVLALDARFLATGIGRYTEQLIGGIRQRLPEVELWCISHPKHVSRMAAKADRVIPCSAPMYSPMGQLSIPLLARGATLLHCPHYDIPALYERPLTVTIHDITHLLDPAFRNTLKARLFAKTLLRIAVKKAKRIITISEYAKRTIVEHLGADEKKIAVIHRYASPAFAPLPRDEASEVVRQQLGIDRNYVLFVGSPKPHKNLPVLFEAFALLRSRSREFPQLVLIGRDDKNEPSLRRLTVRLGIDADVRWIDSVSDELLRACYSAAVATVLPSRQEGFGLPVIESMACGTPVVCANAASLPEIAGDCGLLFDPTSAEECCEQLTRIIGSAQLHAELREMGLMRARQFDGSRAINEHAAIFTELMAVPQ